MQRQFTKIEEEAFIIIIASIIGLTIGVISLMMTLIFFIIVLGTDELMNDPSKIIDKSNSLVFYFLIIFLILTIYIISKKTEEDLFNE